MQKLMRSPNAAARNRAYTMVAFWWPNDARKLDAATEDLAIQDLTASRAPRMVETSTRVKSRPI